MRPVKITDKRLIEKKNGEETWECRCNGVQIRGKLNDVLESCKLIKVTGIRNPLQLNELTHYVKFDLGLLIKLKNCTLPEWN